MNSPCSAVRKHVARYYEQLGGRDPEERHQRLTGVHVRASFDPQTDNARALPFRLGCHWTFMRDQLLQEKTKGGFYITSDMAEGVDYFGSVSEMRARGLYSLAGSCPQRTVTCMQAAMAELYLLSQTRAVVTSDWSAFSEVAARVGFGEHHSGCYQPEGGWAIPPSPEQIYQVLNMTAFSSTMIQAAKTIARQSHGSSALKPL